MVKQKSPIAKFLSADELTGIQNATGAKDGDAIFFGADKRTVVNKVLGKLRSEFTEHFNLKDPSVIAYLLGSLIFPFMRWTKRLAS